MKGLKVSTIIRALKKFGAEEDKDRKHPEYILSYLPLRKDGKLIAARIRVRLPHDKMKELKGKWLQRIKEMLYISTTEELSRYGQCSLQEKDWKESMKRRGIL